jgi:hypothetical protein
MMLKQNHNSRRWQHHSHLSLYVLCVLLHVELKDFEKASILTEVGPKLYNKSTTAIGKAVEQIANLHSRKLTTEERAYLYIISSISFTSCFSFSSNTLMSLFFARNLGSGYKTISNGDSNSSGPAAQIHKGIPRNCQGERCAESLCIKNRMIIEYSY